MVVDVADTEGASAHQHIDTTSIVTSRRIEPTRLERWASSADGPRSITRPEAMTVAPRISLRCGDVGRSWYAAVQPGWIAHAIRTPATLDPAEAMNVRGLRAMITDEDCQWLREYAERHRHVSGVTTRLAYESLRYKRPESKATRSEVGQFMTANNLCTELHRCLGKVRRNRGSGQGTAT